MTDNKITTKKSWRKPKLTVLLRGKPEEMVMAAGCKRNDGGGPGRPTTGCLVATACQTATGS